MKPDPNMMSQAMGLTSDAQRALGRFNYSIRFAFEHDMVRVKTFRHTHAGSLREIKALAGELQDIAARLYKTAQEADERLAAREGQ